MSMRTAFKKPLLLEPKPRFLPVPPHEETISVSRADLYRLAAEAMVDHRTVLAFLSGGRVLAVTQTAIRNAAKRLGIRLS